MFNTTFKKYISYIVAVSFIGGGNQGIQKKPPTCLKSLTSFYHIMLYRLHHTMLNMSFSKQFNIFARAVLFDYQYYMYWYFKDIGIFYSHYTPRKHSLGGGVYRNRPVCPDQLPHLLSDLYQTLWNLRSV